MKLQIGYCTGWLAAYGVIVGIIGVGFWFAAGAHAATTNSMSMLWCAAIGDEPLNAPACAPARVDLFSEVFVKTLALAIPIGLTFIVVGTIIFLRLFNRKEAAA
ncbi:MAG TPA: hypothetical protein VK497_04285 [Candidatus Saccharimonadales bacterium]|nr:hypothetical protein [Candidatus Saccharimonadales bacterium]